MRKQTDKLKEPVAGPTIQSLAPERVRPMALTRQWKALARVTRSVAVYFRASAMGLTLFSASD